MPVEAEHRLKLLHILRLTNTLLDAYELAMPNISTVVELRQSLTDAIRELEWAIAASKQDAQPQSP